ncbi:Winged helix DNA-binding domain-containing protein [Prauserella aidingensis]|uniref:winged helix DNA-binding domain-containing protein n=1 Tax=Prauserella aidingensis TaxID=387890 RepID=UPI0020A3F730|nr:winged helix DNA-binding domain-containing protein [Prauserella aidingensis]MCP2255719.1 Winged helix DNA-binding domain-containing protein [Prauserella aidingensis]
MTTPTMTTAERRARLARRHLLSDRAAGVADVAEGVVALHATDPATVYLSAAARLAGSGTGGDAVDAVDHALYEERSAVRMLGMRRTMFVVGRDVAPLVQAGCAADIERKQRRLLLRHLEQTGIPDLGRWLSGVEDATVGALRARGTARAAQLAEDEPRLRTEIVMAAGKPYESTTYITNRVLFLLAAAGRIVRGRPGGSWLSTQYEWSLTDDWLPGGIPEPEPEEARTALLQRYLRAYGPVREADIRWWTGWTAAQTRRALADAAAETVDLDGAAAFVASGDVEPTPEPQPWVALLPALDPTPMGWTDRDWFVGPHRSALFDRNGNIGPTIWCDGRIVGGWAHRWNGEGTGGEVATRLLEDVGTERTALVAAEAERLTQRLRSWLSDAVVVPRFRTPLERELSA